MTLEELQKENENFDRRFAPYRHLLAPLSDLQKNARMQNMRITEIEIPLPNIPLADPPSMILGFKIKWI